MGWFFAWYRVMARWIGVLGGLGLVLILSPVTGVAQECTECVITAAMDLNLRQDPAVEASLLGIVPEGGLVQREAGEELNGYVPVSYDGMLGWVIAPGLVITLEEIGVGASTSAPSESPTLSADARVVLEPLLLRSGPSTDAEPLLEMPAGAVVTLTQEGVENGYVTVDFDGVVGWAYADFLGEPSGEV
jgi:uncharacterized protein YraI